MKIKSLCTDNHDIKVIEVMGDLTGRGALDLREYLYTCLDEGKRKNIINFKHVKIIDGLGISVLVDLIRRGIQIRLFNVGSGVRSMLGMSRKEDIIKIYNETDCDKAVFLFEKETSEVKDTVEDGVQGRCHPRINTFFPTEFKYHPSNNGAFMCKGSRIN